MTFNGFISYSHAADGRLAPAVQRGLHRLAKPWHRRRALWIFRDQTGLAVTPGLWSSIQTALDGSEYFVLLASPEAARSPWVNREIEHWIATKSADRVLPVVTDGEWAWDQERHDFTEDSTAVPAALRTVFNEEPFFLDLRWARGSEQLSLHHSRFRDAIAQLAAPMHGVSKDELEGEDVRQHRRARRLLSGAAASLVVLTLLASVAGVSAVRNAERATKAAAEALRQKQVADVQRGSAEQSAAEALHQQDLARQQQDLARQQQTRAADAAAAADAAERAASKQQDLADQAAAEARRQQRIADQATKRKMEQQRLAEEASERARQLQQEADRLTKVAADRQREARQAADEAKKQRDEADRQKRIAVSRRLINQAKATLGKDPGTALKLGAAAETLEPAASTRGEVAGLVTSTSFAGTFPDVASATYGPGGVLAVLGKDGRVSLWDVADTNKQSRIVTLPGAWATGGALTFSPDGRTLAVAGRKTDVVLWDVTRRSRPARLDTLPTDGPVIEMVFSADGSTFVVSGASAVTTLWDMTDRTRPTRLAALTDYPDFLVEHLAISPDARTLIEDFGDYIPVYDLTDRSHPAPVRGILRFGSRPMTFSPDGSTLAVGEEGRVDFYDMTHPDTVRSMSPNGPPQPPPWPPGEDPELPYPAPTAEPSDKLTVTGSVSSVAYSPDGALMVTGQWNGTATVWDLTEDEPVPVSTVPTHGRVDRVAFDADGRTMLTVDSSGTASLWKVTTRGTPDQVAQLPVVYGGFKATSFSKDGRSLLTASGYDGAKRWDVTNPGDPVGGPVLPISDAVVLAAAFSPDHRRVAVLGGRNAALTVKYLAGPPRTMTFPLPLEFQSVTNQLMFSPDGRRLAVIVDNKRVVLWDVADPARPASMVNLDSTNGFGNALAFSPDGNTLAVADSSTGLTLWNVAGRSAPVRLSSLSGHSDQVPSLAFSPDGRTLASASFDHTAILWDVTDRARPHLLASLTGHSDWVRTVAFSPDGRTLATAGDDHAVILWDTTDRNAPVRLTAARTITGSVMDGMEFSPDGRTLSITVGYGRDFGIITLLTYKKVNDIRADPVSYACAIAGSGLTKAEWARFVPEFAYRRSCR